MGNKKIIYLTEEGLKDLQAELDDLINVKRPANILSIKEARSLGDLSENADYDAAKNEQAQIEGRIKTIEKMLENVEIIKDVPKDKVGLGSTVGIKYVDDPDDTDEYKIVGSQELQFEESLKQRLEFICEFAKVSPTFINGSIRKLEKTNLTYIEPHKVIIKNITFLVFNYSNDIYITNLTKKIKLSELEEYLKNL